MELDKPVQEWLEMIQMGATEGNVLGVDDMAAARQAMGLLAGLVATPPEVARTQDYSIARTNGEIGARVYWPAGEGPHPIHVNFHGGGFVMGSAFEGATDAMMRARCVGAESIVVSVDYRLAPEHRFPVGVMGPGSPQVAFQQVGLRPPSSRSWRESEVARRYAYNCSRPHRPT